MKRKMSCIQKLMQISFNGNLPLQAAREFLGSSGPKHSLGPGTATPSIFFYFLAYLFQCSFGSDLQITPTAKQKWWGGAEWTCAEVVKICGAEVKAWVASVIWWCLAKNQTLEQLYQNNVDPNLVKKWFPSWKCWTSIKRFYKIPTQQKTNRTNTTGCSQWLSFLIFSCLPVKQIIGLKGVLLPMKQ